VALLLAMSVTAWVLIFWKAWVLRRAQADITRAIPAFWDAPSWPDGRARLATMDREQVLLRLLDATATPPAAGTLEAAGRLQAQVTRAGGGKHAGNAVELLTPPGAEPIEGLGVEKPLRIRLKPGLLLAVVELLGVGDVALIAPKGPKDRRAQGRRQGGFIGFHSSLQQQRMVGVDPHRGQLNLHLRSAALDVGHLLKQGGVIVRLVGGGEIKRQVGFVLHPHPVHPLSHPQLIQPLVEGEAVRTVEV
jgi:hypothetical protein